MSHLANARDELGGEIAQFNQGSKRQPKDHSTEWFLLRAKTLGNAYIQRVAQLGIESDPAACERLYKACLGAFKAAEVPDAPEIVRERLPDGSLPSGRV